MYLVMGILLRPDWYPGLIGHLMIWLLYGSVIYLFSRSQKTRPAATEEKELESWKPRKWLLLAGIFPLAATLGEILLTGFFEILAVVFWFGGILFGLVTFIKAVRLTFPKQEAKAHG